MIGHLLSTLLRLGFALALTISAAQADDDTCKLIAGALMRMVEQPIVLQTDNRSDFPGPIETIFSADSMYANAGGAWKKIDVTGAVRVSQLQEVLKASPLRDCVQVGDVSVNGAATRHFRYAQQEPGIGSELTVSQVWIGIADGLPYKWETGVLTSTMKYNGVAVPP